jgi:hypothetical protein
MALGRLTSRSHRLHRAVLEAVESRRLMSFMPVDGSFGSAGVVDVEGSEAVQVVAQAGGKTLVGGTTVVRRYNADGSLDRSFGSSGSVQVTPAGSLWIDPQTGRAVQFHREGSAPNSAWLEFYDLDGKAQYRRPGTIGDSVVAYDFDAFGRFITFTLLKSNDRRDFEIRRYTTTGLLDTTFGSGGVARASVSTQDNEYMNATAPMGLFVDPTTDAILAWCPTGDDVWNYGGHYVLFDGRGRRNSSFGDGGTLFLPDGRTNFSGDDGSLSIQHDVLRVATNGELTLRRSTTSDSGADGSLETVVELVRLRPDSTAQSAVLSASSESNLGRAESVRIDGSGFVARLLKDELVRFVRYNADFSVDESWGGFAGAEHVARSVPQGWAVGSDGRILQSTRWRPALRGGEKDVLVAYNRPSGGFGVPAGSATLPPGGTIDVAGTGSRDRVRLSSDGTKIYVRINNKTTEFFNRDVSGIVVHTGPGSDRVDVDTSHITSPANDATRDWTTYVSLYIQGGKGSDRLYAGNGADIIEGGSSGDFVDARGGADMVWGGSGNDTLVAGLGGDSLVGGSGDDVLFASTEASPASRDIFRNFLMGGTGRDRLVSAAKVLLEGDARDSLENRDGDDLVWTTP